MVVLKQYRFSSKPLRLKLHALCELSLKFSFLENCLGESFQWVKISDTTGLVTKTSSDLKTREIRGEKTKVTELKRKYQNFLTLQ